MTATMILSVLAFGLLSFAASSANTRQEPEITQHINYTIHVHSKDRTHYIDKHLHRDDEKHARHKQNQTPW